MLNDISLFGEETEQQVFNLIKEIEELQNGHGIVPESVKAEENRLIGDIFRIRESILVSAVNQINTYLEETDKDFSCQIWQELKSLYLYGDGYRRETADERRRRFSAYSRFAFELAKQGKLTENLDLTRDAVF